MELDGETFKLGAIAGAVLTGFFVAGFVFHGVTAPTTPTGNIAADNEEAADDFETMSAEDVSSRLERFIHSTTAPPVRRVEVSAVEEDVLSTGEFYKADVSLYVEPSHLPGPIYRVPENESYTWNNMTFYVTADGKHFFSSAPKSLEIPDSPGPR